VSPVFVEVDGTDGEAKVKYGSYADMFRVWIETSISTAKLTFHTFDVQKSQFPENISDYDVYMITGSRLSAYDDIDWLREFECYIRKLDQHQAKLIGICFGHQIIAKALGGEVIKNPLGWELSWAQFDFNEAGSSVFSIGSDDKTVNLYYSHQDIVSKIPPGFISIGGNKLTEHQCMVKSNYIITIQGHPEFKKDFMEVILQSKKAYVSDEEYPKLIELLSKPTHDIKLAQMIFKFLNVA